MKWLQSPDPRNNLPLLINVLLAAAQVIHSASLLSALYLAAAIGIARLQWSRRARR